MPDTSEYDENEAQKMTRLWDEFEVRHKRDDGVRLRAPREGTYWQLKDGLVVRVAAGETLQAAESEQRALLALAVQSAGRPDPLNS